MEKETSNYKIIKATPDRVYGALTSPKALEIWQAPGKMSGKVHRFDLQVGGGYEMSLYYPEDEKEMTGKTNKKEDRFKVKFIELNVNHKIVQTVTFDSPDPDFSGEMKMQINLEPVNEGTKVTFAFQDIPKGISPKDNEAGTISSLEKLANFVE